MSKLKLTDWHDIQDAKLIVGQTLTITTTGPTGPAGPTTPATPEYVEYVVQAGDTYTGIAAKFGIANWEDIQAVNPGTTPESLQVGQIIRIPTASITT